MSRAALDSGRARVSGAALELRLEGRPLEQVPADLVVAGIFSDERPLRGSAGRIDWRLCGLISDLLAAGRVRGAENEAVLLPTGGRLAAPRVLLFGLGPYEDYRPDAVQAACRTLFDRVAHLGTPTLAGAALGVAPDDLPRHAAALVAGAARGLAEVEGKLRWRLCVPQTEQGAAARALQEAVARVDTRGVAVRVATATRPASTSARRASPPRGEGLGAPSSTQAD